MGFDATLKADKVIFFYNPNAGSGVLKGRFDYIISRYQKKDLQIIPVRAEEDAIDKIFLRISKENSQQQYCQVLIAGGDGTINVCVNAMIKNDISLPIAIITSGTANDFAYCFDIPNELEKNIDIALSGNYTYADVGEANGKYFVNVAAIGQVVDASQRTDKNLKNAIGVLAYYLEGLSEMPDLRPIKMKLTTEDKVYEENMYFMVVMNGKSAGGFKLIAPDSDISDGLLDVVLFRNMNMVEIVQVFIKILQGTHVESKSILHFKAADLLIESEEDIPTDIDGEHGVKLPIRLKVLHKRLMVATK